MVRLTLAFAAGLVLLGLAGYFGTGTYSPTALIPAGFGILLGIAGLAGLKDPRRRQAMHVASAIGLLGLLAAVMGLIMRADKASREAIVSQALMAALCGTYFALCVKSFLDARARRRRSEQADGR